MNTVNLFKLWGERHIKITFLNVYMSMALVTLCWLPFASEKFYFGDCIQTINKYILFTLDALVKFC